MELATFCSSMVLPARGGETIRPRCPLPRGVSRSITRALAFLRIERRQVVEQNLVAGLVGRFEVDRFNLDQCEVFLAFVWRTNLSADGVAGLEIKLANLRRGDVNVVGAGQIVVVGGAEETV